MIPSFAAFRSLPEHSASPAPKGFPDNPRDLHGWVDALPRANAQNTQEALQQAMAALPSRPWHGVARLQALDLLQPVVRQVLTQRSGQLKQTSLPLPPAAVAAARALEALHLAMAQGYRQAVAEWCAPAGRLPMLKSGKVAEALQRACTHYAQSLAIAWRVYRAPLPHVWQSLHCTYAYAAAVKLDRKLVDDEHGRSCTLRQCYLQTLLVMLANPYSLSQSEQDALWALALDYASRLPIALTRPAGVSAALAPSVDAGMPTSDEGDGARQWLDVGPMLDDLRLALARDDGESVGLSFGGPQVTLERSLALRLSQSLAPGVARGRQRLAAGHLLDTAIGLSAVHFHLAGAHAFDAFVRQARGEQVAVHQRAEWAQGSADTSWAQILPAQVLDQSETGYRLLWSADAQARIRVGELVAMSLHDEVIEPRAWLLGMIRWLRYEENGSVSAGVELIALHARAVAMQALARTAAVSDPVRAIEFIGINDYPARGFVASTVAATLRPRQQILRVHDASVQVLGAAMATSDMLDLQVVTSTSEYRLLALNPALQQSTE